MTNQKHIAKKIERGVYSYRGWTITDKRIFNEGTTGWMAIDSRDEDRFFDGDFFTLRDAKDWINKIK